MYKTTLSLILILFSLALKAQVTGKVTDAYNSPLPYVNIYLKNTLSGTISNDNGAYELNLRKKGKHIIVFQFLGFKTVEKTIDIKTFPYQLDVKMLSEQVLLKEVEVSAKENPANAIIKKVIAHKEQNTNKSGKYTADFYSRGLFKLKDAPKKILGQEIGDLDGMLDSTRSGIVYLSETISKITYQKKPKKFKEVILASKVSGDNNGISFNSADEVNFNMYQNQVPVAGASIFSPIANFAFTYYRYKLEGTFYDKNGRLINKIKLIPKRENDRVFGGYIYVVEDDWAIYGVDLTVTGAQIDTPAIDVLHLKQDYNYDEKSKAWALIVQTIDFKVGFLGFKMEGRFSAAYSNYNFQPIYTQKTFTKEVLSFKKNAAKKDTVYWQKMRPFPLTLEEKKDYVKKDSIRLVRTSKVFLDSIDAKSNKFSLSDPFLGYTYKNRYKKSNFKYTGPLLNTRFNTVQGFNTNIDFKYTKKKNDIGNFWQAAANIAYGFSDKRMRPTFSFTKNWNQFEKPILKLEAGNMVSQFDDRNQINNLANSSMSLFFKDNYAKYYDKTFAKISFAKEIVNGARVFTSLEYADRKPLFNTTDFSVFNKQGVYLTNNPINTSSNEPSFNQHTVFSFSLAAQIHFGSKYITYPDSKYTLYNRKYPRLLVGYRGNFTGSGNYENSNFFYTKLNQDINLAAFGYFKYNAKAGMFLQQNNIAFIDYYHPLGNEIFLAPKNRLNAFNVLPYYKYSTNNAFAEVHTQHNFKGFILNRIPLLKKLNLQTVIGAKGYFSAENKPYTEFSVGLDNIGWGKWRGLRVDYVQSYHNGSKQNGFVFGLKLF